MDSINIYSLQIEKAKAMLRYRRLRKIADLFRLVEVCVFLIFLSWFSAHLPGAFRISGEYFKDLAGVLVSPRFVFVLGNVIVLTLFANSGKSSARDRNGSDIYDEIVKNSDRDRRQKIETRAPFPAPEREEIVNTINQSCEEKVFRSNKCDSVETKIHRTGSETLNRDEHYESRRDLRRSKTVKLRKSENACDKPTGNLYDEKEMSNEEFRRTVEAFIARQQKLLREEESCSSVT